MRVCFNTSMSCSVIQRNKDVSATRGRYRDLKAEPEKAHELPEASDWPALGSFIEEINRCEAFRTTGCMAMGVTPGGHSAPYVDVAFADTMVCKSPAVCVMLASRLLELDDPSTNGGLTLELCPSEAMLPDGERIASLRCWLLGSRGDAERIFPILVEKLRQQRVTDYTPIAQTDRGKLPTAAETAAENARANQQFKKFATSVVAVAVLVGLTMAWMFSGYGWLGSLGGFILGLAAVPLFLIALLVGLVLLVRW